MTDFTSFFTLSFAIFCSALNATNIQHTLANKIIDAAKQQIGKTVSYDPQYRSLSYPLGDIPIEKGVCTDVVIRALRGFGVDLQALVHEDMKKNWQFYPKKWGLKNPDKNIDHRRVPNLMTYFERQNFKITDQTYLPGDFIVWDLGNGVLHIGILSNKKASPNCPLVIHNICCGVKEEDILNSYKIVAHYRFKHSNIPQK